MERRPFAPTSRLAILCSAVWVGSSGRSAIAFAQEEAPAILRSETRVVQIDVSVRDSQGHPVADLKASDFTVFDNGKRRAFSIFRANAGVPDDTHMGPVPRGLDSPSESPRGLPPQPVLPRNVFTNTGASPLPPEGHSTIILLDGENGWFDNFAGGREGVLGLLAKLPPNEKIAVYVLSRGEGMIILQDYTLDRNKVEVALKGFIPRGMPPAPPGIEGAEGMIENPGRASSTSPHPADVIPATSGERELAMKNASEDVRIALSTLARTLKSLPGRKSIFWISQGFPPSRIRNEQLVWDKTIASLNDANIAVNTVDSNGLGGPRRFWGPGAILTLQTIAEQTGGQAYFHRNDLDAALASGVADSRAGYTLAFYLARTDNRFHELKVKVDRPGLQLNYRRGYYAQNDSAPGASSRKAELRAALLNPSNAADVKITALVHIAPGQPRGVLNVRLTLDPAPLSLKQIAPGYVGKVEEMFLETDRDGREVARFSDTKEFTIKPAGKPRFDTQGVTLSQAVPLSPAAVKVSIVVRDAATGRTGSLTIPLEQVIPQNSLN